MFKHQSSSPHSISKVFSMILLAAVTATLTQARVSGSWRPAVTISRNETKNTTLPGFWKNFTSKHNDTPLLDWLFTTQAPLCTLREAISDNATIIRDAIFGWLNETVLSPLSCPAAKQGPACAYNGQPSDQHQPGIWICRTMYSPFTGEPKHTTHCANPVLTLTNDTCGSCTGTYPTPCKTSCQMLNASTNTTEMGVLISSNNGYAPYDCVDASVAMTMLNDKSNVACAKL